ncbi:MAG: glycosyltransferase [Desulforhopalus sp.]
MISIIIPAHNEENVIARTLQPLVQGVIEGWLEVVVVCNGCSDNTPEVARSVSGAIKCIETPIPSKTNALNLGDAVAKGFPRFYLDADIVLSLESIQQVAAVLNSGRFLAAAPQMQMDIRHASWSVRSYYEVWNQLPYVQEGMIGTGVYALSEEGRKRFAEFPQIIADDGYVRALFQMHERTTVNSCCSLVRGPLTLEGLLKIKTRSRLGVYELKQKYPDLQRNEDKRYGNAVFKILSKVSLWPMIPVYLYVNLRTRLLAKKHTRYVGYTGWHRDDSSRVKI